ncbi:MAG: ATP-binding protein [Gammaproteobacteria bacterium]
MLSNNNSLQKKITLSLLIIFCLISILVVFTTVFSSKMYQEEVNQKLNRGVAEHIVKETNLLIDRNINHQELKHLFHQIMVLNPSIEIYLLDASGKVMEYSAPAGSVKLTQVGLNPIKQFLSGQFIFPLVGDDPRGYERKKVFSVAPIKNGDQISGYLYIILGGEQVDNAIQLVSGSYILKLSLYVLFAGLFFSLLTGFSFFKWLTNRLKKLSDAMDAYKKGVSFDNSQDFHYKSSGDEIDELSRSFDEMAVTIQQQVEQLKSTDNLRRELVENVSHDLRTPLATLQGYIEMLTIKDEKYTPEERKNYLETALKHCSHLNKLVDQLFDLAKFDAREIKPVNEPFNLSELVQDILQKYQLPAHNKNIVLSANVQSILPLVNADISLIERALDNLLDNALRNTPKGGAISIALLPNDGQVTIEINDTGYGIPEKDLPYVFDRFYQQEKSRSKQGQSGLGLAIVKRIVELHNSQIKVISNLNRGSSFSFRLPIVT